MGDIKILEPSVQSLFVATEFNGQALSTATGFVVQSPAGPLLITNRHVVTGRHNQTDQPLSSTGGTPNQLVVFHNHTDGLGIWQGKVEPLLSAGGDPLWYEHPTLGSRADVVALRLTNVDHVRLYPYELKPQSPTLRCGPTDVVSVVGFPFGVRAGGSLAVWATGFIASEPEIDYDQLPLFLIDCRSREGQSGSPVIAYRPGGAVSLEDGSTAIMNGPITRFMGVYSGRINRESDLGLVWKAATVRELVNAVPSRFNFELQH